jgi:hypothetical protein
MRQIRVIGEFEDHGAYAQQERQNIEVGEIQGSDHSREWHGQGDQAPPGVRGHEEAAAARPNGIDG